MMITDSKNTTATFVLTETEKDLLVQLAENQRRSLSAQIYVMLAENPDFQKIIEEAEKVEKAPN